jgi:hypothetical protein
MGPAHNRSLDPYAPPGASAGSFPTDAAHSELPPGIRRYRLDAAEYAKVLRRMNLRGFLVAALMYVFFQGLLLWNGLLDDPVTAIPNLVAIPIVFLVVHGYVRLRRKAVVASFELLVSERVLRRVGPHVGAAEALRPEVTSIFETKMGLFVVSKTVRSDLFVSRALGGYDEIRAHVAPWAQITRAVGWSGWWGSVRASFRQHARDVRRGTVLEQDPSLAAELDLVRAVSSETWKNYSSARPWTRLLRITLAIAIFVVAAARVLLLFSSR